MSWLFDTLIVTGALIALVLVLRRPVSRWFGPGMAYALWALPLLRLLLPPLTLPAAPVAEAPQVVTVLAGPVPDIAAPAPVWTFAPLFQAVWLAGALAFVAWRAWGYRAMRRKLLQGAIGVGEVGTIRLVESPAAGSPVAFGVVDRVVALPPGFMALTPRRERDLAIAHELEHHNGRDLAVNLAMQPLLALHWFNPLAWIGWRALRRDQEAACDARVLAGREPATREVYGRLIAAFASNRSPALASPLACPILNEKSIVHRLRSLTMTEPTQSRRLAGRLLIGGAALALPLTATITYAADDKPAAPTRVEHRVTHGIVIIDLPEGASPDDKDLHVRTVKRNGKTIVLKTKQPLSDAEAEARIAKAEAEMPPEPPLPPEAAAAPAGAHVTHHVVVVRDHSGASDASAGKGQHHEVRTMIVRHGGPEGGVPGQQVESFTMANCGSGKPITASSSQEAKGKHENARVVICAHDGDKAGALVGLRSARAKIAENPNLSPEMKADVLKQLDDQIAELESKG